MPGPSWLAPVSAEPRPPGAPRCRPFRARSGPWGISPVRQGSAGAASSREGFALVKPHGRLARAASGAPAVPPRLWLPGARERHRLTAGADLGFQFALSSAPKPRAQRCLACADSKGWRVARGDRVLLSASWGFFL